ncbi:hypothetical protein HYS28_03985 [Candidatus Uhrbacteria bacterium]|nr:hypothetical protein [Candidatus Uhrbacteria bacterium]
MNYMYRSSYSANRGGRGPSRFGAIARIAALVLLAVGIFVLAVWWFRRDASDAETAGAESPVEDGADATVAEDGNALPNGNALPFAAASTVALTARGGSGAAGTAMRTQESGAFRITIVADMPSIDSATTTYEAWYVKPGITDFFSLGELFPRDDGKWGLVWETTDALARTDILEFNRILVTREARDGNPAVSADQVLDGTFE